MLYGALVVTLRTCYGTLQIVVLLLLLFIIIIVLDEEPRDEFVVFVVAAYVYACNLIAPTGLAYGHSWLALPPA